MAKSGLPRGIQEVSWKNQSDKRRTVKYRVRVNRKDFKWDELFDTLEEARKCLDMSKTKDGQLGITEREARDNKMRQEAISEWLRYPDLNFYLDKYADLYIGNSELVAHETKKRSIETNRHRLETIKRTELTSYPKGTPEITGQLVSLRQHARGAEQKPFGRFKLDEITEQTANDYVRARLATVSKATARREVGQMQAFFNKLRHFDKVAWDRLPSNPFEGVDKSLLDGHNKKRRRVLSEEEEERLFLALAEARSKSDKLTSTVRTSEMPLIVALALATGMRRGEVLTLRWEQVQDNCISLGADETKSDEERFVILSDDAKAILAKIPRKDERLFHYTADGFKSNWQRTIKKAGLDGFRFHDLRRTMISRVVATVSASPIVIGELTGMKSVDHLERAYIEPIQERAAAEHGITSERVLMQSVGHKGKRMLAHYTNLLPPQPRQSTRSGGSSKTKSEK